MGLLSRALEIRKSEDVELTKKIEEAKIERESQELIQVNLPSQANTKVTKREYIDILRYNIIKFATIYGKLVSLPFREVQGNNLEVFCNGKEICVAPSFFSNKLNDSMYLLLRELTHVMLGHRVKFNVTLDNDEAIDFRMKVLNMQKSILENTIVDSILMNSPKAIGISEELVNPSPDLLRRILRASNPQESPIYGGWEHEVSTDYLDNIIKRDISFYSKRSNDYKETGIDYKIRNKDVTGNKVRNIPIRVDIPYDVISLLRLMLMKKDIISAEEEMTAPDNAEQSNTSGAQERGNSEQVSQSSTGEQQGQQQQAEHQTGQQAEQQQCQQTKSLQFGQKEESSQPTTNNLKEQIEQARQMGDNGDPCNDDYGTEEMEQAVQSMIDSIKDEKLKMDANKVNDKYGNQEALNEMKSRLDSSELQELCENVEGDLKDKIKQKFQDDGGISDLPVEKIRNGIKDIRNKLSSQEKKEFDKKCMELNQNPRDIMSNLEQFEDITGQSKKDLENTLRQSFGPSEQELRQQFDNDIDCKNYEEAMDTVREYQEMLSNIGGYPNMDEYLADKFNYMSQFDEQDINDYNNKLQNTEISNFNRQKSKETGITEKDIDNLLNECDEEDFNKIVTKLGTDISPLAMASLIDENPEEIMEILNKMPEDSVKSLKDYYNKKVDSAYKGDNTKTISGDELPELVNPTLGVTDDNFELEETKQFNEEYKKTLEETIKKVRDRKESIEKEISELKESIKDKDLIKDAMNSFDMPDNNELMSTQEHLEVLADIQATIKNGDFGLSGSSMIPNPLTFEDTYNATPKWWDEAKKMFQVFKKKAQPSYARPNKKTLSQKFILMSNCESKRDYNVEDVKLFLDTSSSMTEFDKFVAVSIHSSAAKLFPNKVSASEFNTRLRDIKLYKGKIMSPLCGSGGTDIDCVLSFMRENRNMMGRRLYVIISDGGFEWRDIINHYKTAPKEKMIFIITSSSITRRYSQQIETLRKVRGKYCKIIIVDNVDKDMKKISWG